MKNTFLCAVASCAILATGATASNASDLELSLGGFFLGYGVYNNQDEPAGSSLRNFDLRKETEIHFKGETTLDNGLTVGVVVETNMDRADDNANITAEESYAYFQGGWGKFIMGETLEIGALLQVVAPSADENIDGVLPQINSFDLSQLAGANAGLTADQLHYLHLPGGRINKVTYMTPVFNGFQAGVTYLPAISEADQSNTNAITSDNDANEYDDAIGAALRYEGSFEEIDIHLGAGWTDLSRETTTALQDDRSVMNFGADFDWGPFGLGVSYQEDDNGINNGGDTEIFVLGVDYRTGPYRFGGSYYNRDDEQGAGTHTLAGDLETTRWTGGVVYEYGPGMSFRGSLSFIESETSIAGDDERDGYQIAIGTQVNF